MIMDDIIGLKCHVAKKIQVSHPPDELHCITHNIACEKINDKVVYGKSAESFFQFVHKITTP